MCCPLQRSRPAAAMGSHPGWVSCWGSVQDNLYFLSCVRCISLHTCLSLNRLLAPLHDRSLVVTVTNLSSLSDKRMSPGLALRPRTKGDWSSAHQKWMELSKDVDDRVSLQAFGGSELENCKCNK